MIIDEKLLEDVWIGEKSTCFFVCGDVCYWVLDYKYNFALDAEKDYAGYLSKGHITREQYVRACREFRGGILRLSSDNFLQYVGQLGEGVLSVGEAERFFCAGECSDFEGLLKRVERHFLSGVELRAEDFALAGKIASRLPVFYINFDRKIYMHMDMGRGHEDSAYNDWFAKCADFSFLIPDAERYWVKGGDFWKLRFLQ